MLRKQPRVNTAARDNSQPRTADDSLSGAASSQPAAPLSSGARVEPQRADDDGFQVELIYSGESDGGYDSKKTPKSPGSPGATEYEPPNEKAL